MGKNDRWLVLLSLVPAAAFLLWYIIRYHYVAPFGEQWGLVAIFARGVEGELSFEDLWRQKNVHRIFFPKLVMLGIVRLGDWNHLWEGLVNWFLGLSIVWGALFAMRPTKLVSSTGARVTTVLFSSAFLLTVSQSENWLWGIQIQLLMSQAAMVWGIALLSRPLTTRRLVGSLLFGFVATFSYSSGLAFWPAGLVMIGIGQVSNRRRRTTMALTWSAVAAGSYVLFFSGFKDRGASAGRVFEDVPHALAYFLAYLGNPVAVDSTWAIGSAAVALVFCVWLSLRLWRNTNTRAELLGPLSLLVLGLAVGAMVCAGRAQLPVRQALSSRYVTFANLPWIGMVGLILLAWKGRKTGEPSVGRLTSLLGAALLIVMTVGGSVRSNRGYQNGIHLHERVAWARSTVLATYPRVPDPALLALSVNKPRLVLKELGTLQRLGLSLFEDYTPEPPPKRKRRRGAVR